MALARVLVVDDKQSVARLMEDILGDAYDVTIACDAREAMVLLAQGEFDVVLTDVRMPDASGFEVLAAVQRRSPRTRVVMMTAFANVPDAVAAMRQGAFDYVEKPLDASNIQLVVARALEGRSWGAAVEPPSACVASDFHEAIDAARERASCEYLVALMRQFGGNVTQAAKQAGMARESLHRVMKQYGVRSEQFKHRPAAPTDAASGRLAPPSASRRPVLDHQ